MNKDNDSKVLDCISTIQIVFITLKLTGLIKWSWLWVLSPAWGVALLGVVVVLVATVVINVGTNDDKQDKIDEMWNGKRK